MMRSRSKAFTACDVLGDDAAKSGVGMAGAPLLVSALVADIHRSAVPSGEGQQALRRLTLPLGEGPDWHRGRHADDRRLFAGHLPERENAAPLPPRGAPRSGRRRQDHRLPPLHDRPDPDRPGHPSVPRPDMPLDEIRAVIQAPDQSTRGQLSPPISSGSNRIWPTPSGPWPRCVTYLSTPGWRLPSTTAEWPPRWPRPSPRR